MRGKLEGAVVILGSATPSAETSYNASTGKFLLARMAAQVDNKLAPRVTIVDQRLAGPPEPGKSNFFSKALITAVFAVIVNLVMYKRLQKISMVESLKSVD